MAVFDKLLHLGEGKVLRRLKAVADKVNLIEEDFEAMSDEELRAQTDEFKQRLADGETLDELMAEAFATVREASRRVLGKRHFDVQIMGGAALHLGNIAEMKTGEGKTLVATLPAYLNALSGEGVHVVTVNDYLAETQSEQMGRVHRFLGLEVGVILSHMDPSQRRKAYAADITYGTNNEFGFDYLRDNMARSIEECVQRGHHYAIVDEVDSILVDEARTPLIISGPAEDTHEWYPEFARIVKRMKRDHDYEVDEKKKTISILEPGIEVVEDRLGIENLYESANTPLISYLNNAIKAKELFKLDRDYVVINGEVLIVDEHTGRTLHGRRYNEGLHQAIEAKEQVEIKDEYQTLATVTLQNFFRMYDKLAGMTGTAKTEESEFQKIYGLSVIPIDTNKPMIRKDNKDLIYRTEIAKFEAIIEDVAERHEKGQPILIGTASVAKSEVLSKMLTGAGVKHEVLNAKNHAREAAIVARAGHRGAVTVATNMAGRGTDIILGGNAEFLADEKLRAEGYDPVETPEEYEVRWADTLQAFEQQVGDEHEEVVELGGLYVVGSERHESRRIDNQLRGRSGRQGDPGESRFYLSLGDDLMRLFKSDIVEWVLQALKIPDDQPIENKRVSDSIASAQKQVESQNFEMRKNVLKYDDVMNRQRHAIYGDRRQVLEGADVQEQLRSTVDRVVEQYVRGGTQGFTEDWDLEQLWTDMRTLYPVGLKIEDYEEVEIDQDQLVEDFKDDAQDAYDKREAELGEENMRELERQVLLTVLDRKWREHLYEMDYLREGIGLRAMAQRDPLVEYQREGGDMFNAMMEAFMEEVVGFVFQVEVETPQVSQVTDADGNEVSVATLEAMLAAGSGENAADDTPEPSTAELKAAAADEREKEPATQAAATQGEKLHIRGGESRTPQQLSLSGPGEDGNPERVVESEATEDEYAGTGRNQPCPCGSGKKYKQCHGRKGS
ncbi:preprotein translocase subunit SecA [Enemella evansiae]|uniref:preprotein translocase subunit SecA n=1 Tax=Enemella evansiae TaxID=2016499 RepID=UPI000B968294|nr:preprotein translocase subunit SecA [Enemella evansiae]OYN94591.1 preprotein translocase subunit SecA [Enemella evansiae]OYO01157.1 preprotein translocase subunit SecA [Enemella evansiae]OYO07585.1 preprotein translocase subunit SecA [Enemella evansiae]PFG67652.1 preprotein translocase subunit SecA [Propionibacteriaceae bacterium ES.041]